MTITIHPGSFTGRFRAPGSKSVTHRALVLALLGRGGTIEEPLWSADTLATLRAVQAFGSKAVATGGEATVRTGDLRAAEIDAANSGTTLRLATGVAALCAGTSTLGGDDSLNKRPMGPLIEALGPLGVKASCKGSDGRPPVTVTGAAKGGATKIAGNVSSQFISALLLAGPRMEKGLELTLTTPLTSAPYVDLTIGMMSEQGLEVDRKKQAFIVDPQPKRPAHVRVPGDYSAAAFPFVAGALTGEEVTVTNLRKESGQGDEALVDLLSAFGCELTREGEDVTLAPGKRTAPKLDLGNNPDLFPPLAVLAAGTPGRTVLHGAPHLRHKESDRIAAMTQGLQALGVKAEATEDGAVIEGGPIRGGTVNSRGDHRVQMAFAVAALAAEGPITIEGPDDAHAVSYPTFFDHLRSAGVEIAREVRP